MDAASASSAASTPSSNSSDSGFSFLGLIFSVAGLLVGLYSGTASLVQLLLALVAVAYFVEFFRRHGWPATKALIMGGAAPQALERSRRASGVASRRRLSQPFNSNTSVASSELKFKLLVVLRMLVLIA